MDNKFVNLPSNYKSIIDEIKRLLDESLITKLSKNEIEYNELNALFKIINKICEKFDCNSFDINKMISGYSKKNSIFEVLKKIATLRNKYLVTKAYKSSIWKRDLNIIKETIQKTIDKKLSNQDIEDAILALFKKYKYEWDGLWSLIETDKYGIPIKINVFDIKDFDFLIEKVSS